MKADLLSSIHFIYSEHYFTGFLKSSCVRKYEFARLIYLYVEVCRDVWTMAWKIHYNQPVCY